MLRASRLHSTTMRFAHVGERGIMTQDVVFVCVHFCEEVPMRILMLGNSFTYYNDLPGLLARLTGAEVVAHTRGSAFLSDQLDEDDELGARTLEALDTGGWDYVILQEMSSRPIRRKSDRYFSSVAALAEKARGCGAVPVIYATWPYREGSERLTAFGLSRGEMQAQLHAAFEHAAAQTGALLADVGSAFMRPSDDATLYASDGVHPSSAGTRLAAQVIAETLVRGQETQGESGEHASATWRGRMA